MPRKSDHPPRKIRGSAADDSQAKPDTVPPVTLKSCLEAVSAQSRRRAHTPRCGQKRQEHECCLVDDGDLTKRPPSSLLPRSEAKSILTAQEVFWAS